MTIVWGGFAGHMRVGIDCRTDPYDANTPAINVYVDVYVQCDSTWNFDDNQHVDLSGSVGGAWDFHNGLQANQSLLLGTAVIAGQGQSYGGGPTYNFTAVLSGNYLGVNSSVARSFTLPARPARPPSAPGAPVANAGLTATTAGVNYAPPSDIGGAGLDYSWLQVAKTSDVGAAWSAGQLLYDNQTPGWVGRNLTGLAPGTTYYARAAAHNAAGWSPFSAVGSFTTAAFPGAPSVSVGPDTATVTWAALPAGDTATGYQVQYALDAGFTSGVQTITSTSWGTSRTLTGLTPATTYYVRVRTNTASGYGAWSPATSTQTLSGAKVRSGGSWVNAPAYARVGGQWKLAKVYKRVGGAWVL